MKTKIIALAILASLTMAASPAWSVPVNLIQVGTWTGPPGTPPLDEAGLQTGGKYVIHTTYDTTTVNSTATTINGVNFYEADLQAPGNSFRIQVPMEGFDGGTPFVYDQNQGDHFPYPGAPVPTIQFTSPGGAPGDFFGYTWSGNFEPGAGNHFIDMYTSVVPVDIGGGTIVNTPFQNTEAIRCPDPSCGSLPVAINSVNSLVSAINPLVDAGSDKSYSAGALSVTTSGGAVQSNNLGAGRSDGEDFLTFDWTTGGTPLAGSMTADGVNIAVAIQNSGLTNTTDSATWQVEINEDLTGLGGDTDSLTVSYNNADPVINAFSATPFGNDIDFALSVSDADLGINSLIPGFEALTVEIYESGILLNIFDTLINTGSQSMNHAALLANFGAGPTTLEARVFDLALGSSNYLNAFVTFTVNDPSAAVPEPETLLLLLASLLGVGLSRRQAMA